MSLGIAVSYSHVPDMDLIITPLSRTNRTGTRSATGLIPLNNEISSTSVFSPFMPSCRPFKVYTMNMPA
jgi:hypothetical protein